MSESLRSGPNISSLWIYCISLYRSTLAWISVMFKGCVKNFFNLSTVALELFGLGVKNLWRTLGTMLKTAAEESFPSKDTFDSDPFMLATWSWSHTNVTRKRKMMVRRHDEERRRPTEGVGIWTRRRPEKKKKRFLS